MSDKKKAEEMELPQIGPNGELPEGWEYPGETDDSTITAKRVSEATMQGEDFIPANPAEEELKEEITQAMEEGAIIEVPSDE